MLFSRLQQFNLLLTSFQVLIIAFHATLYIYFILLKFIFLLLHNVHVLLPSHPNFFQNFYFPFVFQCLLSTKFQFQVRFFFSKCFFFLLPFSSTIVYSFWLVFFSVNLQEFPTLSLLISKISHSYFSLPLLGTLSSSTSPIFFKIVAKNMNNTKAF